MVHNLCCTDTWVGITGEHESGTCKVHAATCLALNRLWNSGGYELDKSWTCSWHIFVVIFLTRQVRTQLSHNSNQLICLGLCLVQILTSHHFLSPYVSLYHLESHTRWFSLLHFFFPVIPYHSWSNPNYGSKCVVSGWIASGESNVDSKYRAMYRDINEKHHCGWKTHTHVEILSK